MYNALLVLSQSTIPSVTALPPSHPHLPPFSPPISLASSAPVSPNHRHKRQLPNWFVSLSVKARGYLQYVLTCLFPNSCPSLGFYLTICMKKSNLIILQTFVL